jgi:hypothetical protein
MLILRLDRKARNALKSRIAGGETLTLAFKRRRADALRSGALL